MTGTTTEAAPPTDPAVATPTGADPAVATPTGADPAVATPTGATPADAPRAGAEPPRGGRPSAVRRYLPPQHGAWAMLLLPFALGVICSRPVLLHVPLLVAWLGGYLLSYYALLAVKTGRPGRVAGQLRLYGAVAAPCALLVAVQRPAVLAFAPVFAVLLGVNAVAARRRADRSLAGGLASVLQGCLMVGVAAVVAGTPAVEVAGPALALLAYFAGSLLYVKTMIRNRGEAGYLRASIAFHALALAAAAALAPLLAIPFGWLLVRSVALPRTAMTPKQVGLAELAPSLALLVLIPMAT